ncbi:4Fe-4S dicluster domain-containing protein [Embleya scabrispora]|uniref:4Fe-4S dicluster domain-containing protein n=1 Tax=Embleya scabrispora TaxID=159449 RepID=UPI000A30C21F|nr:4Fe-4S dicluster domain-containing protein [Embleya scabrispora]MYS87475.1 4Fe-4S dicluster domain-containing protein [Streptomyces sp. SID5474]
MSARDSTPPSGDPTAGPGPASALPAAAHQPTAHPDAPVLSKGTLVIDVDACKGCDLCIDACPVDVLRMTVDDVNDRGYRYPQLLPGCIACKACSAICPDFVFQVYRYDEPRDETGGTRG